MKIGRKCVSVFLSLLMALSMFTTTAFASGTSVVLTIEADPIARMWYQVIYDGKPVVEGLHFDIYRDGVLDDHGVTNSRGELDMSKMPYGNYELVVVWNNKEYRFQETVDESYKLTENTRKTLDLGKSSPGNTGGSTKPSNPPTTSTPPVGTGGNQPTVIVVPTNPTTPTTPTTPGDSNVTIGDNGTPLNPYPDGWPNNSNNGTNNGNTSSPTKVVYVDRPVPVRTPVNVSHGDGDTITPITDDPGVEIDDVGIPLGPGDEIPEDQAEERLDGDENGGKEKEHMFFCIWFWLFLALVVLDAIYIVYKVIDKQGRKDERDGRTERG